jgi:hypothetical protein
MLRLRQRSCKQRSKLRARLRKFESLEFVSQTIPIGNLRVKSHFSESRIWAVGSYGAFPSPFLLVLTVFLSQFLMSAEDERAQFPSSKSDIENQCAACKSNESNHTIVRVVSPQINVACLPTVLNQLITSYAEEEQKSKWKKRDLSQRERWFMFQEARPKSVSLCLVIILWGFCGSFALIGMTQRPGQMRQRVLSYTISEFRPYPVTNNTDANWVECGVGGGYPYPPNYIVEDARMDVFKGCTWPTATTRINVDLALWIGAVGTCIIFVYECCMLLYCWFRYDCCHHPWRDDEKAKLVRMLFQRSVLICYCKANQANVSAPSSPSG